MARRVSLSGEFDRIPIGGRFSADKRYIEEMIEKIDLADVLERDYGIALFPSGGEGEYSGHCPHPDHRDSSPSFSLSNSKGLFHCFGCGFSGTLLQFLMKVEGFTFREALLRLSELSGMALEVEGDEDGVSRPLREISRLLDEFLDEDVESDLPAGVSEDQFFRTLANRLRDFENATGGDAKETAWVDTIYEKADRMSEKEDMKGLARLWRGLSAEIGKRRRQFGEEEEEIETYEDLSADGLEFLTED